MKKALLLLATGLSIICLAVAVIGYPFKWLWNWIMPSVFGMHEITFWQSCGILLLLAAVGSFFKSSTNK